MSAVGSHPPLVDGDRLSQPEFHRRYLAMPEDARAELIDGIVYRSGRVTAPHGEACLTLSAVLGHYQAATPGVDGANHATTILGPASEVEPDLSLLLRRECGGRTRVDDDDFLVGPPELIVEVAHSSTAIDLHAKKDDYKRAGVREYLVLCIDERELPAFDLPAGRSIALPDDGVYRSAQFPGLWIDVPAVLAGDAAKVLRTARRGLRSPEHAAFAKRLKGMLTPPAAPAATAKKRRRGRSGPS